MELHEAGGSGAAWPGDGDDGPLPLRPGSIGAKELGALLAERYPGVVVRDVRIADAHELTNTHAHLVVDYDESAGAPSRMFCKLPPQEAERRQTINATGMGAREVRFYARLAPVLPLRVPTVHAAHLDERDGTFVLLMEELAEAGCTVSDGTVGVTPDSAAVALEDLAGMHVRFEDPARRAAEAPWVARSSAASDYAVTMLRYGIDHHRDKLTDAFVDVAELYIRDRFALHEVWEQGEHTVLHGDAHLGNVFDDHGRTGFLDWGMIRLGTPMRDVSYFLSMALNIDDRRGYERDLLAHYLDVRHALGGREIGADEAWLRHRLHAAYCVPASCQVVLFPEDATPRRQVFANAFLHRAEAAVEDLETMAALASVGVR
jgi:aminoglycoside phosphotransferase (APT) family kinase protein